MLLCRVYRVIAIYPKTMGKRQGINEQEILGNQSSTADKKLKTNEFLTFTTRPWSRFSMFELLFIKNSRPENCEALRWNFSEFYDLNQNLLLNNTYRTLKLKIIFTVPKNYPLAAKPQLKSEDEFVVFQT